MALSSMLCIPLWIFIKVWQTEGTLPEVRLQEGRSARVAPKGLRSRAGLGSLSGRLMARVESIGTSLGLSFLIWAVGVMRTGSHMSLREAVVSSSLAGVHHDHYVEASLRVLRVEPVSLSSASISASVKWEAQQSLTYRGFL